jgi:hypothetical protein
MYEFIFLLLPLVAHTSLAIGAIRSSEKRLVINQFVNIEMPIFANYF